MSFVLHLFYAPEPLTSLDAATEIVWRDATVAPKGHLVGRLRSWQGGMVEACPDLSEEDPDGDRPDNAWPEGLPEKFDVSVYNFAPNVDLLDAGLMGLIAEGAALVGLHVLDPQNGLLYRPDRRVLDRDGHLHAPPKPVVPQATRANLITEAETKAVLAPLEQRLGERLAPFGFRPRDDGIAGVIRRVGELDQCVEAGGFFSHGEIAMSGRYRIFAPGITSVWAPVVRAEYERHLGFFGKYSAGRVDGFAITAEELCGPSAEAWGRYRFGHAKTREQAQRWFHGFGDHVIGEGLPQLDGIATPRDLAAILLTEHQHRRLDTKNDVPLIELFGRLVLVHAFDRANAAAWHADIATHCRRCNNYTSTGWQDAPALIERVAEHLSSHAFDPTVVGGDARVD